MHIHLDLVGGISGDMFAGAMLDCFPDLYAGLAEQIEKAGFQHLVTLSHEPHNDGILTGTRFKVHPAAQAEGHEHRHYSEIKKILESSSLDAATKQISLAIFHELALAEASIHGKDVSAVAFHEVGAWDSIADVISAATLIAQFKNCTWSMSSLPLGSGQVNTAHGMLPIPAPATSLLLEGFECFDDGVAGERITPTGAAVLKYLSPDQNTHSSRGNLSRSGHGFGTKKFPGMSNVLRVLVFETNRSDTWQDDQVLKLEFEVDDQTAEDLSIGLEHIRRIKGVLDVLQYPAYGKKGRLVSAIQVLGIPADEHGILTACFEETTTLGIRKQLVSRSILEREQFTIDAGSSSYRVKAARRPSGSTIKVEMDDIAATSGNQIERASIREKVESQANQIKTNDTETAVDE
jgi:uncharacterized protein (TIGR00299 family) protein